MPTNVVDVLVITALKDELEAFKRAAKWHAGRHRGVRSWRIVSLTDEISYEIGDYHIEGKGLFSIALARPERMGGIALAPVATLLADRLKPTCLAMCGVCAGNPDDAALGDVIIANLAFQWDEGKSKPTGFEGDLFTNPAPAIWGHLDAIVAANSLPSYGPARKEDACRWFCENIYLNKNPKKHPSYSSYFPANKWNEWIKYIEEEMQFISGDEENWQLTDAGIKYVHRERRMDGMTPNRLPFRILVGPMASGNYVAADGESWDQLATERGQRKTIGLEMEAAAIGFVARVLGIKKWVVMKGVMDHADLNKDNRFKPFAARASAEALIAFLLAKIEFRSPPTEPEKPLPPRANKNTRRSFSFMPREDNLSLLIVGREQGSEHLEGVMQKTVGRLQGNESLRRLSGKKIVDGENYMRDNLFFCDVGTAFDSQSILTARLDAICRADVVVFDVTSSGRAGIEPGVMLLLGVRSVVRRGVSICSIDCDPERLFNTSLPYNLQHLNISSHLGGHNAKYDVVDQMARKIISGFADLDADPFYLDLPAFDAIRYIGGVEEDYTPIPFIRGPLYLGPFDPDFELRHFSAIRKTVIKMLRVELERSSTPDYAEPRLYRLMDYEKARMVSQTLYQAIRRHDFCLIDWTGYRPNVFFEAGVRLACRQSGDVHIMARVQNEPACDELSHINGMTRIFSPIKYDPDDKQGMAAIGSDIRTIWETTRQPVSDKSELFRAIAQAVVPPKPPIFRAVTSFLRKRASFSYLHAQDTLLNTVLYEEYNYEVQSAAAVEAATLQAAVLFLTLSDFDGALNQDLSDQISKLQQDIARLSERDGIDEDVAMLRNCSLMIEDQYKILINGNQSIPP